MKKLSKILNESAWGDMRKRSSGDQIRKEDDINLLDIDGLFNYVENNYSDRVCEIDSEEIHGFQGWKNCVVFPFDDNLEITITRFLDTGKIRDIVIMWDKNGVQDSFLRKLNDRFNICLAARENAYIDIKDKDGSVSNQTYIDLLDFVLENGQSNVLVESTWGDMRKRSSGEQIRKEDDVDIKSPEEFFDYLRETYRIDNSSWDMSNNEDALTLCIPFGGMNVKKVYHIFCLFFDYEDDVVYINNNNKNFTPNLWSELEKHYDLWKDDPDYDGYTIINPLDKNRPVNNSYVLEVLNFVMSNMDSKATPCIFKKTNESTWGDMRKRSSGDVLREEDVFHFNIKDMKPIDLGSDFPVYWADIDLEANGTNEFDWEETERMIPQIEKTGWRLPKAPNEIFQMFGKDIVKRDEYLHRFWMAAQGNGYKGVISSEETGETLKFISDNPHCVSYWCTDDWVYLSPGGRINFENERCFDVSPDSRYEGEFSLIRTNNMNRTKKIRIRLVKDK